MLPMVFPDKAPTLAAASSLRQDASHAGGENHAYVLTGSLARVAR
jgi:hypothetical protein